MTKKVVIISLANPGGHLHGGEVRLRGFEAAISANGYDVEICEIEQAPTGEHGGQLWQLIGRVKRHLLPLPLVRRRDAGVVIGGQRPPGTLLLSTVPAVTYALTAAGHVVHWADYFDLPSRFAASEAGARRGLPRLTALAQGRALAKHHERSLRLSSLSTYAGYGDYIAAGRSSRSHWVPPVVRSPQVASRKPVTRPVAGFLANFNYWPNVDALANLIDNWLTPLSRDGFDVVVAGFGADQLSGLPPQIRNLGQLDTLEEFYASVDVVLIPVRRGSGIKVKAIEGLLSGRPVLVDPHVLDGFPPEYGAGFQLFTGQTLAYEALVNRAVQAALLSEQAAVDFGSQRQQERIGELLHELEYPSHEGSPNA